MQRMVSFLPSATELIYALNAQDRLFGVTHECLYPDETKDKPRIIDTVVDSENLDSKEINDITCSLMDSGKDIFVLNEENIKKANPDLLISQNTCEVCAAHTNQVQQAMEILNSKPELYSMDPHNVKEILTEITKFSETIGVAEKGKELRAKLEDRIQKIKNKKFNNIPRVLAIEWINPFFTAGHWVPEMIEMAGGVNMISKTSEHSRRITIEEIINSNPEIIIMMPCGFDVKRTEIEYKKFLTTNQKWNSLEAVKQGNVFAVDANSFFSKPSIRTITGIEILAKIIHPNLCTETKIPERSSTRLDNY